MRILINHRVDPDTQGQSGYAALTVAVYWNHHDAVQLLLEVKATHTLLDARGWNILPIAAQYSDHAVRQILIDRNLDDLDAELRDKDGQAAGEIFFDQKFKRLTAAGVCSLLHMNHRETCSPLL
jgi:ankyrin repeat protein